MMRRAVILAIITVTVVAAAVWITRHTYWAEIDVPMVLRGEARTNPFYATQRFAQALGSSASWHRTFAAPPLTNGVVVMSGWHWGLSEERRHSVERWVASGGRLVVDASVADDLAFQNWSGISLVTKEEQPFGRPDGGSAGCHPLIVSAVSKAEVGAASRSFVTCGITANSHLASKGDILWQLSDAAGAQVIMAPAGNGRVTVINARPFLGSGLVDGDHAVLFIAATGLRTGDEVWLLSEADVPPLLTLLWQRGSPAIVLLLALVGLGLWRIGARFGPLVVSPTPPRRSLEEQIVAAGEFSRRYGTSESLLAATQQALEEAAFRRIPGYARLSADEKVTALAKAAGLAPESLFRAMRRTDNRTVDPVHIMETARRRLLTQRTRT